MKGRRILEQYKVELSNRVVRRKYPWKKERVGCGRWDYTGNTGWDGLRAL